ncbi:hypothetical protein CMI37_27815 [Candidatus Pacearchaeota archaeon]|nr:hypothetical protein [Candidatus Pacearchaeota archaeon]
MLEDLEKNIRQEKKILAELNSVEKYLDGAPEDKESYLKSRDSLLHQLKMLNKAVPELLKESSPFQNVAGGGENKGGKVRGGGGVVKMSYVSPATKEKSFVAIGKKDKKEFLKKLQLSESGLEGIAKAKKKEKVVVRKPSSLAKISSRFFRERAEKMAPKFTKLTRDLKKANIPFLVSVYISIALFVSSLAFIAGLVGFGVLIIFSLGNWIYFWIPFAAAGLSWIGFYYYPSSESNSVQKKIAQELPFAAIHMAAIAGSDIEPTKIFKIIATSKEYVHVGKEMRKVINQTEIYGYDLVTSLKNVARRTSSKKLSELFSGLATNISSGGELKSYLEKKAENYLLDYKLERRKYSDLAGTFMDIYISILIAAPLVLMMMFIVMNVAGLGLAGLTITTLLAISIGVVILVNIIFLFILNWKQPSV